MRGKGVMMECKDCKWWNDNDNPNSPIEKHTGQCRRNSPIVCPEVWGELGVDDVATEDTGVWPFTDSFDWCGEFKSKIELEPEEFIKPEHFSTRTFNILTNMSIKTFAQLSKCTEKEILKQRCAGKGALREIIRALADRGYRLLMCEIKGNNETV